MSGGKDRVLDMKYGRQGGRRTTHEGVDIEAAPRCSECDGRMVLGQPGRHWICSPSCDGCHRPVGPPGAELSLQGAEYGDVAPSESAGSLFAKGAGDAKPPGPYRDGGPGGNRS